MKAILRYLLLPMFALTSLTSCEEFKEVYRAVLTNTIVDAINPYQGWQDVSVSCKISSPLNGWDNVLFKTDSCYYSLNDEDHRYVGGASTGCVFVETSHSLTSDTTQQTIILYLYYNYVDNDGYIKVGEKIKSKNCCCWIVDEDGNETKYVDTDGWFVLESIENGESYKYGIASGQFEFSAVNEENPKDTIEVKCGQFNHLILINERIFY